MPAIAPPVTAPVTEDDNILVCRPCVLQGTQTQGQDHEDHLGGHHHDQHHDHQGGVGA